MISQVFPFKLLQIYITSVSGWLHFTYKTCQIVADISKIGQFHEFSKSNFWRVFAIWNHSMEAVSRQTFENGITCSATCENRPPCFPIKTNDGHCMEFTRSSSTCGSGATSVFFDRLQKREQLNQLTSYV